jgi:twitching motility protein PilT
MHNTSAMHAADVPSSHDTGPMDALFRAMCAMGASDLHLSCGSVPIVRKDGRMMPLQEGAGELTSDYLMNLLLPILPAQNQHEYRDNHDSDFAY